MKLSNKLKVSLLIAFFVFILFNLKVFAVTGTITDITVNLRKEPSTSSNILRYVTQDDIVDVLEKVGEWYKIKFKGTTGYVFGKYVKVDDSKLEESKEDTIDKKEEDTETSDQKENTENSTENKTPDVTTDIPVELKIKEKTNIRLIPNITSSIVYTTKKNLEVTVIEQLDKWAYVSVDNVTGWVRADNIVEENSEQVDKEKTENNGEEEKSEAKVAYIKYDTVNLRKKASTSSTVLAKLKLNEEVTVLEKINSTWSKVRVDGQEGYISTELLADEKQKEIETTNNTSSITTSRDGESISREEETKTIENEEKNTSEVETTIKTEETKIESTTKTETEVKEDTSSNKDESKDTTTTSKTKGEEIVEYAKKYLGYKYVYGGASPKTGFDCSGLTYYVYKNFGYTISRTSKAQATNGKEVAKSDLQPGDLIIFKNQSLTAIGHVGIYIGNNKIIHASEPGVGVVITDMDASGYNYNKRYVTARRII